MSSISLNIAEDTPFVKDYSLNYALDKICQVHNSDYSRYRRMSAAMMMASATSRMLFRRSMLFLWIFL